MLGDRASEGIHLLEPLVTTGEMAGQFRALAALLGDPGLVPVPTWQFRTSVTPFPVWDALLCPCQVLVTHGVLGTHAGHIHTFR